MNNLYGFKPPADRRRFFLRAPRWVALRASDSLSKMVPNVHISSELVPKFRAVPAEKGHAYLSERPEDPLHGWIDLLDVQRTLYTFALLALAYRGPFARWTYSRIEGISILVPKIRNHVPHPPNGQKGSKTNSFRNVLRSSIIYFDIYC